MCTCTIGLLLQMRQQYPEGKDMDLATVNVLCFEDFVNVLGNVVDKCPIITAAVWSRRPFVTFNALESAIFEFIDALPQSGESCLVHFHTQEMFFFF